MLTRRDFLSAVGAAGIASPLLAAASAPPAERKRLAVVTTVWWERSHAWHMAERFLHGYPWKGRWHQPPFEVVSAFVDQRPENDLSRQRAAEFGFSIYPTIAETLRCGGDKMAVDAVLIIGEHGEYPNNEFGQKKYPRYEFFKQVTDVFRQDQRTAAVFNDKHLSWKWEWAQEMVDLSRELNFAFSAGSSLPVTWRMPAIDMPYGAEVEEVIGISIGDVDSYDFHALEMIQCMAERRHGGEQGIVAVQALRGDAFWQAMNAGAWDRGGWDACLFEACLCRSHTLSQPKTFSHRYPTLAQMRERVSDPIAYRLEYADGLKGTMLMIEGLVGDFTFAARLKDEPEPLSTLFQLPPAPNVVYSAALMSQAEATFTTGRSPCPIERTLLTTGMVAACVESLGRGNVRIETPHLRIAYQAPRESTFARS